MEHSFSLLRKQGARRLSIKRFDLAGPHENGSLSHELSQRRDGPLCLSFTAPCLLTGSGMSLNDESLSVAKTRQLPEPAHMDQFPERFSFGGEKILSPDFCWREVSLNDCLYRDKRVNLQNCYRCCSSPRIVRRNSFTQARLDVNEVAPREIQRVTTSLWIAIFGEDAVCSATRTHQFLAPAGPVSKLEEEVGRQIVVIRYYRHS